jgi:hypothetical protein
MSAHSAISAKDIVTTDRPPCGVPDATAADRVPRRLSDPGTTTEHLRSLWQAGGRNITVSHHEEIMRHRSYLARPQPDKPRSAT